LWIDPGRHVVFSSLDFREESVDVLVVKREATRQKRKEDNTTGPNISCGPAVFVTVHDLRAGIVRATAASLELKGGWGKSSHAPICDLD